MRTLLLVLSAAFTATHAGAQTPPATNVPPPSAACLNVHGSFTGKDPRSGTVIYQEFRQTGCEKVFSVSEGNRGVIEGEINLDGKRHPNPFADLPDIVEYRAELSPTSLRESYFKDAGGEAVAIMAYQLATDGGLTLDIDLKGENGDFHTTIKTHRLSTPPVQTNGGVSCVDLSGTYAESVQSAHEGRTFRVQQKGCQEIHFTDSIDGSEEQYAYSLDGKPHPNPRASADLPTATATINESALTLLESSEDGTSISHGRLRFGENGSLHLAYKSTSPTDPDAYQTADLIRVP